MADLKVSVELFREIYALRSFLTASILEREKERKRGEGVLACAG